MDQVLDAVMHAFWAKGYEATSLADLMAATGLHKGSLYQAFGDKHSLFLQGLKRYLQDMRAALREELQSGPTPLDSLRAAAHRNLDFVDADAETPKGCLAVNSLVELAPHDEAVKGILQDHMSFMLTGIGETIAEGQLAGLISKERPPEVLAAMIATFMMSLAANLRGVLDMERAHQLLDEQLNSLL